MMAIYFWFPLFIFGIFSFSTQSLEIGLLALILYYLWQYYNKNSNLNNLNKLNSTDLPNSQENNLTNSATNNQPNSEQINSQEIQHLQNHEPRKIFQNIKNIPLSQISFQKWFLVIIPIILFVFLAVFWQIFSSYFVLNLFLSFLFIIFYYFFIGLIYLVSQLINKIYNSQNLIFAKNSNQNSNQNKLSKEQKINSKAANSEISNKTGDNSPKNIQKIPNSDKIKSDFRSNLLSKWHFWAILVFSFLINLIISFNLLVTLLFQTILFTDFAVEILPIYLNLLILGLLFALVFFGIKNQINSILLSTILIISLFWSLGNLYSVNTYLNFANFSTCKDFKIVKQNYLLYYLNEYNQTQFLNSLDQRNDEFFVKIEYYNVEKWQNQKIGETSKLDKVKSCLIPVFENKKVILIEEKAIERDPNFPELPSSNSVPLPSDSNFSTTELPNNFLIPPKPPNQ